MNQKSRHVHRLNKDRSIQHENDSFVERLVKRMHSRKRIFEETHVERRKVFRIKDKKK